MTHFGIAPAQELIAPRVLLFAGSAAQAVRTSVMAAAGEARGQMYSSDCSARSSPSDVAGELTELLMKARQASQGASPIVPLMVVASEDEPPTAREAVDRALQLVGDYCGVAHCWLYAKPCASAGFSLAPRFRDRAVDSLQKQQDLVTLASAFALSRSSRMAHEGFDAFRACASGRWLVSVERECVPDPRGQATRAVDASIAAHIVPCFSRAVRAALFREPARQFFHRKTAGDLDGLAEMVRVLDTPLAEALLRLKAALGDLPPSERLPEVESLIGNFPFPLLHCCGGLATLVRNRTALADALAREREALIDTEARLLLAESHARLQAAHHEWCPPNVSLGGQREYSAVAFGLRRPPLDARCFVFLPAPLATNDIQERWLLNDTCAYLNFISTGDAGR